MRAATSAVQEAANNDVDKVDMCAAFVLAAALDIVVEVLALERFLLQAPVLVR